MSEIKTPSKFYRNRRPEFFSDSERVNEIKLPREQFVYELNQISTNQKQDAFETFGRRLLEKLITPNLIPQVGPTGGGDGKTDAETYPVSELISDRWFVPENGWNRNENWAIAISAKKDWKSKIKSDVAKIVHTDRGYTKIFFLTNQVISSKKKKDMQDELRTDLGIEIVILDGEWIIESVYTNDLISLAVDSLHLSDVYKSQKVIIGGNDASRIKTLAELEEKINNTKRYFDFDYQLVEDALEAAILTRMLERPKDEVMGKFDRALRFAKRLNNVQQLTRICYQKAWTYIHWYDAYSNFIDEFNELKKYVKHDINQHSIELYFNLLNILSTISNISQAVKEIPEVDFISEEAEYRELLEICIANSNKPTTQLIAKTFKSFLNISHSLHNKTDVSEELKILQVIFQDSKRYLEYPFESFKTMVEIYGEVLPDNKYFDELIDSVAEIFEKRASELASGEIFLNRGYQKLSKGFYKDSLIYFGKSVRKLAKDESKDYLYYALMGLKEAYSNLGLLWAANNCIIAACSITVKEWYNEGKLHNKFFSSVKEGLENELFLGRLPYILHWYELLKVLAPKFEEQIKEKDIPAIAMADACLAVRLLNTPYDTWERFSVLPDMFNKENLWLSQDASLFILGYPDLIDDSHLAIHKGVKCLDEYYNLVANQPFNKQIVYDTNLLDSETIEFKSVVLGTEVIIKFKRDKEFAILAEALLAFLESFLATSFEEVFPATESITVNLKENKEIEWYKIIEGSSRSLYEIQLNISNENKKDSEKVHKLLLDLASRIIGKNFIFKDAETYLQNLFEHDEVHERQSLILEHRKFLTNLFGDNPKLLLEDWVKDDSIKLYKFKREFNPIEIEVIEKTESKSIPDMFESIKHNQLKAVTIIDAHLWDNAKWKAFGFFVTQDIPLGIFLAYENKDFGKKIFEDWIKKFGKIDEREEINLSIIKGIDRDNPFWYRVHVSKAVEDGILKEGQFMMTTSRFHEMNAENPKNLTELIYGFNYLKQYTLCPAYIKSDLSIELYFELGILKKQLIIKDAWEVGEKDFDRIVIKSDDNPIIPDNITDAPVISLLNKAREN